MSEEEEDDFALLTRYRDGDKGAGSKLFQRYWPVMHRFFSTKLEPNDVEEATQETFLALQRSKDHFRGESSFRTFLFGIAKYVLYEQWKRKRRADVPMDFDQISVAALSTTVGTRLDRKVLQQRMLSALHQLPLEQQTLLELAYWERLEGAELAKIFGVEPATIRSRLFRAREALRKKLEEMGATDTLPARDDDSSDDPPAGAARG
jgi:RNA polymerase sigma-70 factor (ECF subfamily)